MLDGDGAVGAVAIGDGQAAVALEAGHDAVLPPAPVGSAEAHGLAGFETEALDAQPQPPTRAWSRRMPLSHRS